MIPNLLRLISRRVSSDYDRHFVQEVRVTRPRARNPKVDRLFLIVWVLIVIKCAGVMWAVPHYHIPFSAMWVVLPTIIFAAVCTAVYYRRR